MIFAYDSLTRPEAMRDFYENAELIALTKELTDTPRKNKSIDWEKREDAVQTILAQCKNSGRTTPQRRNPPSPKCPWVCRCV